MADNYGQNKVYPSPHGQAVGGIILRDYFAAAALQGLLAGNPPTKDANPDELAKLAVSYADALVLQLQPKKKIG
jgi:hypothetical protein